MAKIDHFKVDGTDHGTVTFTRDRPLNLKRGQWSAVIDGVTYPSSTTTWPFTLTDEGTDPGISSTMNPPLPVGGHDYCSMTASVAHIRGGHLTAGEGDLVPCPGSEGRLNSNATWAASDTSVGSMHGHEKVKA
jgi:hypothetical protein